MRNTYLPTLLRRVAVGAVLLGACFSPLQLWSQTPVGLANLVFVQTADSGPVVSFDILGGTDGTSYDVFRTTGLAGSTLADSYWTWIATGYSGQSYSFSNQPTGSAFYVIGDVGTLSCDIYNGLFFDTNGASLGSSGSFMLMVKRSGQFQGNLLNADGSYPCSGCFSSNNFASVTIPRPGRSSLTLQMQLGRSDGAVTGVVSDGNWTAACLLNQMVWSWTNLAPEAGQYTLAIPGASSSNMPAGYGWATVAVDMLGNALIRGSLADGTAINLSTSVSKQGQVPVYIPLYSGSGCLVSWLTFMKPGLSGAVNWTKLPQPAAAFYPAGFDFQPQAIGAAWQCSAGSRVLNWTNGQVILQGGNLTQSFTNQVVLNTDGSLTNLSSNNLRLSITPSTGAFRGTVVDPATRKTIVFAGVLLQSQDCGYGYFLSTNQSGSVFLGPQP